MPFLPDTNIWISLLKNPGGKLESRVRSHAVSDIFLCAVVKAELWHGAEKYGNANGGFVLWSCSLRHLRPRRLMTRPRGTTARFGTDWNLKVRFIGPNDLKIAAIARNHGLTLVSSDPEFTRAPGLRVEDWMKG